MASRTVLLLALLIGLLAVCQVSASKKGTTVVVAEEAKKGGPVVVAPKKPEMEEMEEEEEEDNGGRGGILGIKTQFLDSLGLGDLFGGLTDTVSGLFG